MVSCNCPCKSCNFILRSAALASVTSWSLERFGEEMSPLLVHLPLARVQLLLIALQLVIDVVVSGLRLGQRIPQLNVVFVLRLGFVQRLFGVAQGSFRVAQQGVCHLFSG